MPCFLSVHGMAYGSNLLAAYTHILAGSVRVNNYVVPGVPVTYRQ